MIGTIKIWTRTALLGTLVLGAATAALAQQPAQAPPPTPTNQPKDPGTKDAIPSTNSLTLNAPVGPISEEDAAFKTFANTPITDSANKIRLGEAFAQKYTASRYLPFVYSTLIVSYVQAGQIAKVEEVGEKAVALTPNDVQTLSLMAQSFPRSITSSTPQARKEELLAKAEKYSKRVIEITPTLSKPDNVTDQSFAVAKNQALSMAYGALGLVLVRRGDFAAAVPELERSVKFDVPPDPVNFYLLGLANERTSRFEDAAAAFTKCSETPSSLQATCKSGADEAKKRASTQLSAPK
ncbi:MAG: hypothetical protein NVS9B4_14390 [Candidatus Acidiferrum sp.]